MSDIAENPYEPPKSDVEPEGGTILRHIKQRPVWLVVVLAVVTLGYYMYYWYWVTSRQINDVFPVGRAVPRWYAVAAVVLIAADVGLMTVSYLDPTNLDLVSLDRVLTGGSGILILLWAFKVREGIWAAASRVTGEPYPISALATFFLGLYYLQYKINRMPLKKPQATSRKPNSPKL